VRKRAIVLALLTAACAGCGKDEGSQAVPETPSTGACCSSNGLCTVTPRTDCTGTWTGVAACSPNPCPAPPMGTCCLPGGGCIQSQNLGCPGTWTENVLCRPGPCPQPPPGMAWIPGGTFWMGSPEDEPGRRTDELRHRVTLTGALYVSLTDVAQSEWEYVMHWNESYSRGVLRPVENVTWFDAVEYCNQRSAGEGLTPVYSIGDVVTDGNHIESATVTANWTASGYRLLTEAEWEYCCRGESGTAFCNGSISYAETDCGYDPGLDLVGWYCGNAASASHDVGGKTANNWGMLDMHGNVWEWCWDWYGDYSAAPASDPQGPPSGPWRVRRGGSWSAAARACRSAERGADFAYSGVVGLRVARRAD
jgi:formylglycine-generating enzyme required for sulfatase activity